MRHIAILCGNGGLFLDFEMSRGADGANTGYCFPDMLCDVVRLSQAGQRDQAHDLFDAHLPLLRYEQQQGAGLAVRKYVMQRRGLLTSDAQRKPQPCSAPPPAKKWSICSRDWRATTRAPNCHRCERRQTPQARATLSGPIHAYAHNGCMEHAAWLCRWRLTHNDFFFHLHLKGLF